MLPLFTNLAPLVSRMLQSRVLMNQLAGSMTLYTPCTNTLEFMPMLNANLQLHSTRHQPADFVVQLHNTAPKKSVAVDNMTWLRPQGGS